MLRYSRRCELREELVMLAPKCFEYFDVIPFFLLECIGCICAHGGLRPLSIRINSPLQTGSSRTASPKNPNQLIQNENSICCCLFFFVCIHAYKIKFRQARVAFTSECTGHIQFPFTPDSAVAVVSQQPLGGVTAATVCHKRGMSAVNRLLCTCHGLPPFPLHRMWMQMIHVVPSGRVYQMVGNLQLECTLPSSSAEVFAFAWEKLSGGIKYDIPMSTQFNTRQ